MNRSILLTAVVFCIATTYSFAQTEESRYENAAGNLVVKWSDGTSSTYGKDPTGKENLGPDPKIAERMYDSAGNRREIDRNGKTLVIEAGDESVRTDRMNDRSGSEPEKKADKATRPPGENSKKSQSPK